MEENERVREEEEEQRRVGVQGRGAATVQSANRKGCTVAKWEGERKTKKKKKKRKESSRSIRPKDSKEGLGSVVCRPDKCRVWCVVQSVVCKCTLWAESARRCKQPTSKILFLLHARCMRHFDTDTA